MKRRITMQSHIIPDEKSTEKDAQRECLHFFVKCYLLAGLQEADFKAIYDLIEQENNENLQEVVFKFYPKCKGIDAHGLVLGGGHYRLGSPMPAIEIRNWCTRRDIMINLADILNELDPSLISSGEHKQNCSYPSSERQYVNLFKNFDFNKWLCYRINDMDQAELSKMISALNDFLSYSKYKPSEKSPGSTEKRKQELKELPLFKPLIDIVRAYDQTVDEAINSYLDSKINPQNGSCFLTLEDLFNIQAIMYPDIMKKKAPSTQYKI